MKTFTNALAGAAALFLTTAPAALVHAQAVAPDSVDASATVTPHGDWTLKEREDWLANRLDKAKDDGSLDSDEYHRVHHDLDGIHKDESQFRDHHDGQLTDNETADLEARLDSVAAQIHWLHDSAFQKPW